MTFGIDLSDECELDLKCAFADKNPCLFVQLLHYEGIDADCSIRKQAEQIFQIILAEREREKYENEYPNGE